MPDDTTLPTETPAPSPEVTRSRRPSWSITLALLALAVLTTLSLALPGPNLGLAAARTIPDRTIPTLRPDAGRPTAVAALSTPITISIADASRTLTLPMLADLGGVALAAGAIPSLRITPETLAELLGPELLAALNRSGHDARIDIDADARDGIRGVIPDESTRRFDLSAAARSLSRELNALVAGQQTARTITLPLRETEATMRAETLEALLPRLSLLGAETIRYIPSLSNAYGTNILVPGRVFAGQLVMPGASFDFWERIGPVTRAAGYRQGGAFLGGVVVADGAFAGGICATATALYAAAVRAGLPIEERKAHYSYLPAYPLGLDATVWKEGRRVTSMRFRNDTSGPLVIVVRQATGYLRVELHGIDDGRRVELVTGPFEGVRYGAGGRAGGRVTVTRTVYEADGTLRSREVIRSAYSPS